MSWLSCNQELALNSGAEVVIITVEETVVLWAPFELRQRENFAPQRTLLGEILAVRNLVMIFLGLMIFKNCDSEVSLCSAWRKDLLRVDS